MAPVSDLVWNTEAATNVFLTFNSIALWSTIPLTLRIFVTLKQRRSLYFNAILATTWGLCIRGIAYEIMYFSPTTPWYGPMIISQLGWILMVSGFATVLWSRLGFIIQSERVKKYTLWMIVFNGFVFHTAMTILTLGFWGLMEDRVKNAGILKNWVPVQRVFEKMQLVCFCGQEILIGSLYIRSAYLYLREWSALETGSRRKVRDAMILLLAVQTVVVLINIAIITIDCLGLIALKGYIHPFVYCVKLEVEFVVLNQLVEISKLGVPGLPSTQPSDVGESLT